MWPDPRLCELFGIAHPILQSPMVGSDSPDLAAAVGAAGGLGAMGTGMLDGDAVTGMVERYRGLSNRPVNLNFFAHAGGAQDAQAVARAVEKLRPWYDRYGLGAPPAELPDVPPGFGPERLELTLRLRPAVASFHFGLPEAEAMAALKDAGILVISTATTVAEARALEAAGVDAIVAQGYEAGGHRGSHAPTAPGDGVGTLALVPQVVDAVRVPVIAAGGIADGRGIAAALALGAAGVQIGTAFLRCPEAATDATRRAELATTRDSDTVFTAAVSGRAARGRRSAFADAMAEAGADMPLFPSPYSLTRPLLAASAEAGDEAVHFRLYGQAGALAREMPAADLVARLVEETGAAVARLG
ncbi:nitronate monooxygenase [Psychromarinibacter sp. C21-152]|uniref:Nitronate monooxygenase n=1 Tax=Psychromarinibacter sediminicola TaxID=3033385 RepID=A0AAE3NPT8_9RHOB|nr:nitronate monooxygenase [Psychromarinibacter sediminicola]MDF0599817.1 nitronate monooxygenase [Psychromarinibacter sediminicola]